MCQKYNIVELFSGIGSQAKALKNIGMEIGEYLTCEWDLHAFVAYDAIHNNAPNISDEILKLTKDEVLNKLKEYSISNNGKEKMNFKTLCSYSEESLKRIYSSIIRSNNKVNVSELKGEDIPDNTDILTYSFPCQDLSNVGAFHGYNKGIDINSGSRSSLLWQVGRILNEMKLANKKMPRYLVMENVPTLLSNRHIGNFNIWINKLKSLGYENKYKKLNAKDFGLPQNRPRLIMISVYVGDNKEKQVKVKKYLDSIDEKIISDYCDSKYFYQYSISDLLRIDYKKNNLLNEAIECTPNRTVSRKKIWDENPQIISKSGEINRNLDFVRTITTKQDRHPNSGNLYFNSKIDGKAKFRYLTPRECFLFMGFTDEDFDKIIDDNTKVRKNNKLFPRDKLIRMAGNSIPVKLLEGVFYQIKLMENMNFDI